MSAVIHFQLETSFRFEPKPRKEETFNVQSYQLTYFLGSAFGRLWGSRRYGDRS